MEEYISNYIGYVREEIRNFQKKNDEIILEKDVDAIIELLEISIRKLIESESGYHMKITDIIENAIDDSKNIMDVPSSSMIDALYDVKRNIKYNSIIKTSPLLTSISKNEKGSKESLYRSIPAIDLVIESDKLMISGYSKEGSKTVFEIHKGDRYVTKNDIDYISMQDAINNYSEKNKNIK